MGKGTKGLDVRQARHLAHRLHELLAARYPGASVTAAAEAIGVPQSQLSSALHGDPKRSFGVSGLIRLREHFRVSIDDLLGLEPLPSRPLPPQVEEAVWQAMRAMAVGPAPAPPAAPEPPEPPAPRPALPRAKKKPD